MSYQNFPEDSFHGAIALLRKLCYTSIHTMVDACLLAYADVTYVGQKYEDAAREEEGKQVRALGKKERCKSC